MNWNLKGKTEEELTLLFQEMGEPKYRATQAFRRINSHLIEHCDGFTEFPLTLRKTLEERVALPRISPVRFQKSSDGTEKALFSAGEKEKSGDENKMMETVWIPSDKRNTICISSQFGCSLNCAFCATATLEHLGNIPAWQILDQVYEFIRHRGERPGNIVFMGMGEPFYNYDNVIRAARILHHPHGLNISAGKITISTAGVVPGIRKFIQDREPFNLAISLNHADSTERSRLMDINQRYPLPELLETVMDFTKTLKREVTFEYVCIPGYNMSESDASKLIKLAHSVKSKVNLIPLNVAWKDFRPPSDLELSQFYQRLQKGKIPVFNRGSSGKDIDAACGMLALKG